MDNTKEAIATENKPIRNIRKLTNNQREFILSAFFALDLVPHWRKIAEVLLDEGSCIVAGESRIWNGGVGNFIQTANEPFCIGCLRHTFDLEMLLSSPYFLDSLQFKHDKMVQTRNEIDAEILDYSILLNL